MNVMHINRIKITLLSHYITKITLLSQQRKIIGQSPTPVPKIFKLGYN